MRAARVRFNPRAAAVFGAGYTFLPHLTVTLLTKPVSVEDVSLPHLTLIDEDTAVVKKKQTSRITGRSVKIDNVMIISWRTFHTQNGLFTGLLRVFVTCVLCTDDTLLLVFSLNFYTLCSTTKHK